MQVASRAMVPPSASNPLPPEIDALLRRLRRRIRWYAWAEGITATAIVLGAGFWGGLMLDWMLEPVPAVRAVMMLVVAFALAVVLYRLVVRRAFVRLPDASMAVLLERTFHQFHDRLLTVVDLADSTEPESDLERQMVDFACRQVTATAAGVRPGAVLNWRRLARKASVAAALALSIVLFGMLARQSFGFWVQRLMLSSALWPRRTRLVVAGFPRDAHGIRSAKVARGGDFKLLVKADATLETPPPEAVEVRFRQAAGGRGRAALARIGDARRAGTPYQSYQYRFQHVMASIVFDVVGGDARVRDLHLEVVERPQIVALRLLCRYPAYLGRLPGEMPVTGAMAVPEGTQLKVQVAASKELAGVRVQDEDRGAEARMDPVDSGPRRQFALTLPPLHKDRVMLLTPVDRDQITSAGPYRLVLHAVPDVAPRVTIDLAGIGPAITPTARLPVGGVVTDDHGLGKVWFEYQIDENNACVKEIASALKGLDKQPINQVLDTEKLPAASRLAPGHKLRLAVKASDLCDLRPAANVGSSQYFSLQVVTPGRLRVLLDRRELLLRQRFETLVDEMVGTRDLLARLGASPAPPAPDSQRAAAANGSPSPAAGRLPPVTAARRRLQFARVRQNLKRAAHEILDVADAFDDIRRELINNRIDTPSHRKRLRQGISEPLVHVGRHMLPAVLDRLPPRAPTVRPTADQLSTLREATAQVDAVLDEMKQILSRMLELESYNELLDQLRAIIETQTKINQKTAQQRKEQLRSILEK